jgi:hypothetical protein
MKHGLAVGGDVVDHVFVDLHGVGQLRHRPELDVVLMLGEATVVMLLDHHAHFSHHRQHLAVDVRAVDRRHWK